LDFDFLVLAQTVYILGPADSTRSFDDTIDIKGGGLSELIFDTV
jgi:hypothetical protein